MAQEVFHDEQGRGTVVLIEEEGINPVPTYHPTTIQPMNFTPEDPIEVFKKRIEQIKMMIEEKKIDLAINNTKALQTAIAMLITMANVKKDTALMTKLQEVGVAVNELATTLAPLAASRVPSGRKAGELSEYRQP
jgi:hypothetical protein